ncbi:MAG TPA: hypothetical protein VEF34_05015 [Syntrophobacteraceae bacterium]|nr:hypothetical protein [Syntrophobacteraceae bacterium]
MNDKILSDWQDFRRIGVSSSPKTYKEHLVMPSKAITTVIKMMESLPEPAQEQIVVHLRQYLEELQDELRWDNLFRETRPQLIAAAKRAKQEIAAGQAKPMDPNCL